MLCNGGPRSAREALIAANGRPIGSLCMGRRFRCTDAPSICSDERIVCCGCLIDLPRFRFTLLRSFQPLAALALAFAAFSLRFAAIVPSTCCVRLSLCCVFTSLGCDFVDVAGDAAGCVGVHPLSRCVWTCP